MADDGQPLALGLCNEHADPLALEEALLELGVRCLQSDSGVLVLDFGATDDPLHGRQEGRFFHGYYGNYCHLPLYCFCGSVPLWAKLRMSDKDASAWTVEALKKIVVAIRRRFPKIKIVVRGDSGVAREAIMAWCEAERDVFYLPGMARNRRLEQLVGGAARRAAASFCLMGGGEPHVYGNALPHLHEVEPGAPDAVLKFAAVVQASVRRVHVALCSASPLQDVFRLAASRLQTCAPPGTS